MRITRTPRTVAIGATRVRLARTAGGVVEIEAADDRELAAGLGFAHAHDRLVQMVLMRLVGQGRLAECLRDDPPLVALDLFARTRGFTHDGDADAARLAPEARILVEAYCRGVNTYLERHRRPLELWLAGHRPEPWTAQDTLLTIKLTTYFGLAQTQEDMEKFIISALHDGVPPAALKRLFAPHLDGLDDDLVPILRTVHLCEPLIPPAARFLAPVPRFSASNNWVVAGRRSATGRALACFDPHLEVNRLPAIWYELVGRLPGDYRIGITMPGVPGLVMGRTRDLAFGLTYGFMDMVDYFVEEVKGGLYRKGAELRELARRREVIRRKGAPSVELTVFENEHGVLESDPGARKLEDGYYLCRAWSGHRAGVAPSMNAFARLPAARTVAAAQAVVREVALSGNWLLADRAGDIAYQQSGLLPVRRHSGLHPVPGWRSEFDWQGIVPPERLARALNPPEGFLATANDEINPAGGPLAVNLCMGDYRVSRIRELLAAPGRLTVDDMKRIQRDLHSRQAERFLALLRPCLPDTPAGRLLSDWDLRCDRDARGATLFHDLLDELRREVFGNGVFGAAAWDAVAAETGLLCWFHHVFDRALLGGDPAWFGTEGRDALFRRVVARVLEQNPPERVPPWGERRQITMTNLFFAGALPGWLGFDHGPIALEGSGSTLVQSGIFRAHGRSTTFAPSWRFVADLGTDEAHTVLAGGPSGRRASRLYLADVERWLGYEYKRLEAKAP